MSLKEHNEFNYVTGSCDLCVFLFKYLVVSVRLICIIAKTKVGVTWRYSKYWNSEIWTELLHSNVKVQYINVPSFVCILHFSLHRDNANITNTSISPKELTKHWQGSQQRQRHMDSGHEGGKNLWHKNVLETMFFSYLSFMMLLYHKSPKYRYDGKLCNVWGFFWFFLTNRYRWEII